MTGPMPEQAGGDEAEPAATPVWGTSGTTSIPPGRPVPACRGHCAVCRAKRRQWAPEP